MPQMTTTTKLGEGNGTPLQYFCLENPMDRGAWEATIHGGHKELDTTKRLHSLCTLSLEKEMATHSSILAWRIPWTEKPGRPWSMGSQSRI